MRQADDDRDFEDRIDRPWSAIEAGQLLEPHGIETDRSRCDHVTECEHHRRDKDGCEQQRFEPAASRQVRAHHQERKDAAERDRDEQHSAGDDERVLQRRPEVTVFENEPVTRDTEGPVGIEERCVQETLDHDKRQRQQHRHRQHRDHNPAEGRAQAAPSAVGQGRHFARAVRRQDARNIVRALSQHACFPAPCAAHARSFRKVRRLRRAAGLALDWLLPLLQEFEALGLVEIDQQTRADGDRLE